MALFSTILYKQRLKCSRHGPWNRLSRIRGLSGEVRGYPPDWQIQISTEWVVGCLDELLIFPGDISHQVWPILKEQVALGMSELKYHLIINPNDSDGWHYLLSGKKSCYLTTTFLSVKSLDHPKLTWSLLVNYRSILCYQQC